MPVPLNTKKYGKESFFGPNDFLRYIRNENYIDKNEQAPTAAILSYQKSLFSFVLNNYDHTMHTGYFKNHLAWLGNTNGRIAIVGNFGIGAPAAAAMLEELIAYGVSSFLSIGTAGSLVSDLAIGDIIVCSGALRDEGTSYHYIPTGEPAVPDAALSAKLCSAMRAAGMPYTEGKAWTTDGIYRETKDDIAHAVSHGALCVEMEAAALFAVAAYRAAALASAFTVSDILTEDTWQPAFHSPNTQDGLETLYAVALHTLRT